MAHPLHDILMRWLSSDQYAFDPDSTVHDNYWPSERLPVVPDFGASEEPEPQS